MILLNLANERWHSDRTFARPRGSYSMLYGRIVPNEGARTEFCDTRRAFERLPDDEKRDLRTRTARHTVLYSRIGSGVAWSDEQLAAYGQPIIRPLVHMHEESGRLALCLGSYAFDMSGLEEESSARKLNQLVDAATEPSEIYSHRWAPGDLLVWDNRCTMHRATPYDHLNDRRDMLAPPRVVDLADSGEPTAADGGHA
jgi:alpha-ketoglutarate-dependent 2,4-dichlorophenoxyacetate dioxygenase